MESIRKNTYGIIHVQRDRKYWEILQSIILVNNTSYSFCRKNTASLFPFYFSVSVKGFKFITFVLESFAFIYIYIYLQICKYICKYITEQFLLKGLK